MRLIDADAAVESLTEYGNGRAVYISVEEAVRRIEQLPSVQPERPKGKWIHQVKFSRVECDQCGKVFRNSFAPKNFCPNCGADMRGEQNG